MLPNDIFLRLWVLHFFPLPPLPLFLLLSSKFEACHMHLYSWLCFQLATSHSLTQSLTQLTQLNLLKVTNFQSQLLSSSSLLLSLTHTIHSAQNLKSTANSFHTPAALEPTSDSPSPSSILTRSLSSLSIFTV